MMHVDRPSPGDSKKFLEHRAHLKQKERQTKIKDIILALIIVFAMGGLYGLHFGDDFNEYGDYPVTEFDVKHFNSDKTYNDYIASKDINRNIPTTKTNKQPKNVLSINGHLETYEEIKFLVKGFDPSALYLLDYGDGRKVELGGKEVFYRYSRPGFFKVKLFVEVEGIRHLLFSKMLDIAEAPEILSYGGER